ncbi:MAG: hypothetical protein LBJ91_04990 [Clostridiales Family XIII bacterium]|nr:hypothetical protein [Clostridiales Family XIII bacterium]
MNNNILLPFERNRYYPGKLLTSTDFLAEQSYLRNKRTFINSLVYGSGIICGMSVYNLDDTSIMVESGVAVDGLGQEIVLENSIVRKLSAIDGYNDLKSSDICLCLRYGEEDVQPVYAVGSPDRESDFEMNRIREGCTLFLVDADALPGEQRIESEFFSSDDIYADGNFSATLRMPSSVPRGRRVRVELQVEKLSDEDQAFALAGVFGAPAFTGEGGEHEFHVDIPDIYLKKGEVRSFNYYIDAKQEPSPETMIIAKPEDVNITVGGETRHMQNNVMIRLSIVDEDTVDIVERELAKVSLDARSFGAALDYIRLADITIERSSHTVIISGLRESGVKYYIPVMANAELRRAYAAWFSDAPADRFVGDRGGGKASAYQNVPYEPVYSTGVCEIPLGIEDKKGRIYYSGEIVHGLGAGDVHVSVGIEYLAPDEKLGKPARNTIYGDPNMFDDGGLPVPRADLAVRVMSERGSFIVAAKLAKATNLVVLLVRWTATRLPSMEAHTLMTQIASDAAISPLQPTVVVAPNESRFIDVRFKNMAPCALEYELTEKKSGTITPDGIYTASNREGVHEIHIFSPENPFISTYAYVVVKQKDRTDGESCDVRGSGCGCLSRRLLHDGKHDVEMRLVAVAQRSQFRVGLPRHRRRVTAVVHVAVGLRSRNGKKDSHRISGLR